jgi:hypothetical protein
MPVLVTHTQTDIIACTWESVSFYICIISCSPTAVPVWTDSHLSQENKLKKFISIIKKITKKSNWLLVHKTFFNKCLLLIRKLKCSPSVRCSFVAIYSTASSSVRRKKIIQLLSKKTNSKNSFRIIIRP